MWPSQGPPIAAPILLIIATCSERTPTTAPRLIICPGQIALVVTAPRDRGDKTLEIPVPLSPFVDLLTC